MTTETFVDALAREAAHAKEVLGELRSELREVRRERAELAEERKRAEEAVRSIVEAVIHEEVSRQLEELGAEIRVHMDKATRKVHDEVEGLFKLYMTGKRRGTGAEGFDLRDARGPFALKPQDEP